MAMNKVTVLTQGYTLPLNAVHLFGVGRLYRIPYTWGTLQFCSE